MNIPCAPQSGSRISYKIKLTEIEGVLENGTESIREESGRHGWRRTGF